MGSEIPSPTIWILDKWLPFCQKPFEVQSKCLDFVWSCFRMVGAIATAIVKAWPFEIRPSKSPDFEWSDFRSPKYYLVSTKYFDISNFNFETFQTWYWRYSLFPLGTKKRSCRVTRCRRHRRRWLINSRRIISRWRRKRKVNKQLKMEQKK